MPEGQQKWHKWLFAIISHCIFPTTLSQTSSYLKGMKAFDSKSMCVCVLVQSWTPKHLLIFFLKKKVIQMTKQTNKKERPRFDLTFILIFTKFMVQKRHRGEPNQDYWGVCCFMALFRTVLSGRLNTKLYCRQLPRATFCFETIKGKNKLPSSVWSKTQHKKCQEDLKCQFLYSQCVYLGLLPVWEQDGLLFLFSF